MGDVSPGRGPLIDRRGGGARGGASSP
jgi:hypothetical protein